MELSRNALKHGGVLYLDGQVMTAFPCKSCLRATVYETYLAFQGQTHPFFNLLGTPTTGTWMWGNRMNLMTIFLVRLLRVGSSFLELPFNLLV